MCRTAHGRSRQLMCRTAQGRVQAQARTSQCCTLNVPVANDAALNNFNNGGVLMVGWLACVPWCPHPAGPADPGTPPDVGEQHSQAALRAFRSSTSGCAQRAPATRSLTPCPLCAGPSHLQAGGRRCGWSAGSGPPLLLRAPAARGLPLRLQRATQVSSARHTPGRTCTQRPRPSAILPATGASVVDQPQPPQPAAGAPLASLAAAEVGGAV